MKLGTSTTWKGMMSVAMMSAKSRPLPRNGSTANAKAAIEQLISAPTVARVAILSELRKKSPNVTPGSALHMRS